VNLLSELFLSERA